MVQIEFDYNQKIISIQANLQEKFQDIINRYIQKSSISSNNVCFTCNGCMLNPELAIEQQMNDINKINKKMKILVNLLDNETNKINNTIIKSKEIICPKCYEPCRIKFENYRIKLYECKNNHISDNIYINNFNNTQNIDISKIKCYICKEKNKSNTFNNEFYICLNCKENICPL